MAKQRFRVFGTLLLLLTMLITACGNTSKQPVAETTEPVKKEPVELMLAMPNTLAQNKGTIEVIAMYEKASGNKVQTDVFPDAQFLNVMKTKMSTGDAPDIVYTNLGDAYIPFTFLEPLDFPWKDKVAEVNKPFAFKDGQMYEAPMSPLSMYGLVYNKEVFEKAGIQVPIMNYEELIAACEALLKIGVTPIGMPGKTSVWMYDFGWVIAAPYVFVEDPTLQQKLVTNEVKPSEVPELLDSVKRWAALEKYMNRDHLSASDADIYKGLVDGTIAMEFYLDFGYEKIAEVFPDQVSKLSLMPITLGDDYISAVQSLSNTGMGVPKNAKHKEEAKQFIDFMVQPDHYNTLINPLKGPAPYDGYPSEKNQWQIDMENLIQTHQFPITADAVAIGMPNFQFGDIATPFQNMFVGMSVEKALDEWYDSYAKINRAAKTPGF